MGLMVHFTLVMGLESLLVFPFPLPPSVALLGVSTNNTSGPLISAMSNELSLEAARKPMSDSERQVLVLAEEEGGRRKPATARQPSWKGRGEGMSERSM